MAIDFKNLVAHQTAHILAAQAARHETVSYHVRTKHGTVLWRRCGWPCLKCQSREVALLALSDFAGNRMLGFEMPKVAEVAEPATPSET